MDNRFLKLESIQNTTKQPKSRHHNVDVRTGNCLGLCLMLWNMKAEIVRLGVMELISILQ